MKLSKTPIEGLFLIEPKVFGDSRGFFFESWNERVFQELIGRPVRFVQDNHSRSGKGVLRGLHYQRRQAQGKLVRVTAGMVWDVAVDIREGSSTFGTWWGTELSEVNHRQLWIPEGMAHGFLVLSDFADFLYKTTNYWDPVWERSILWSDPNIGIDWPLSQLSPAKDEALSMLKLADRDKFAKGIQALRDDGELEISDGY
ncbi:MAG: dTDP-4-dehydrorhamnose 3,5-epimerase [Betaproteobacteria bacterium]|nr:dTDP-4-dehydrorhamnose 3,5-epimerase [Betaproteobacteria bacterium]